MHPTPVDLWEGLNKCEELTLSGLIAYQRRRFQAYRALFHESLAKARVRYPLLTQLKTLEDARGIRAPSADYYYAVFGIVESVKEYEKTRVVKLVDGSAAIYLSCRKESVADEDLLVAGTPLGFLVQVSTRGGQLRDRTTLGLLIGRQEGRLSFNVVEILLHAPPRIHAKPPLGAGIAMIGDVHIGAQTHLELDFLNMLEWINRNPTIGYLFLVGDSLDGRNVYPGHDEGLKIKSVEDQCHALGKHLGALRADVSVVMIMGNHQGIGTRREPQIWPETLKAIIKSYRGGVVFASNPGYVAIGQYRFLLYHGASADPLIARCERLSYQKPTTVGQLLVRYRDLCPCSDRIPIMPTKHLYHMIPENTDYLVTGHIHKQGRKTLPGGLQLVSTGTWQHVTPFQARLGFRPDYAVLDVLYPGESQKDQTVSFRSQHTDSFRYKRVL